MTDTYIQNDNFLYELGFGVVMSDLEKENNSILKRLGKKNKRSFDDKSRGRSAKRISEEKLSEIEKRLSLILSRLELESELIEVQERNKK